MIEIVQKELDKHGIKVIKWSSSSCGFAEENKVKIPKPIDYDTLGVCFHEIGHVVLGHFNEGSTLRYIEEYQAEMYAIQKLKEYGFYNKKYEYRAISHVLMKIAQAKNRGHNMKNVPKEIVKWTGLQVNKWNKAKKVFVTHSDWNTRAEVLKNIRLYKK